MPIYECHRGGLQAQGGLYGLNLPDALVVFSRVKEHPHEYQDLGFFKLPNCCHQYYSLHLPVVANVHIVKVSSSVI